jgi:hypothetical protein
MAYLRLRQICLVAQQLEPRIAELTDIFGLAVCHRDGNVAKYGLVNALLPVGASFLEVVVPIRDGTAAGRYLERRGGDGGYMVILDCDDIERRRRRMETVGVRIANALRYETYTGIQLHPRDTGGSMLEFNHTTCGASLDGPYHPAGPDWHRAVRHDVTTALLTAELQSPDPATLAARWSEIIERPVTCSASGDAEISLDLGAIRFVPDSDGRGEGLRGVGLHVADRRHIVDAAARRGCRLDGDAAIVCGTRFRLVSG